MGMSASQLVEEKALACRAGGWVPADAWEVGGEPCFRGGELYRPSQIQAGLTDPDIRQQCFQFTNTEVW